MGRIALAWRILTNGALAAHVNRLLESAKALTDTAASSPAATAKSAVLAGPMRSEAIDLLASMQREGRLVDFLKEPIDDYSDAQIGAAVRDIHRDCGAVLERQFAIRPVLEQPEGSPVSLTSQSLQGRIKLSGKVGDGTSASGTLVHHGWQSTKCEVPVWTGDPETASILAPAEVEVR